MPVLTDADEIRDHVAAAMGGRLDCYLFAADCPEVRDGLRGFVLAAALGGVPESAMTFAELDVVVGCTGLTSHLTLLTVSKAAIPATTVAAFLSLAFGFTGGLDAEQDIIPVSADPLGLAGLLDAIRSGRAYPVAVGTN